MRCIRFDSKRIVSGAYDGKIKVWDLVAALDPRAPASALCLKTLEVCIAICFPFGSKLKMSAINKFHLNSLFSLLI